MGNTRQYESQNDGHQKGSFRPEDIPDCQQPVITALLGHVAGLFLATGSRSNLLLAEYVQYCVPSQVVIETGKSGRLCQIFHYYPSVS